MSTASEIVSGLRAFACATEAGVSTFGPIVAGFTPGALKSTVTSVGARSCPGGTRANSSRRFCGFSTMPTTRRVTPPCCQLLPIFKWKSDATPLVTATSSGALGKCPERSESIGLPKGPLGFWARN